MSERDNYRLDFEFPGLIEQIEDRGDYVAFRTPSLPGFFWGNYLLFPNPPGQEDYDRWRAAFRAEFGSVEKLHHEAFGWDTPTGEVGNVEPFVEAGFRVSRGSAMLAKQVTRPPHLSAEVEVRVADLAVRRVRSRRCPYVVKQLTVAERPLLDSHTHGLLLRSGGPGKIRMSTVSLWWMHSVELEDPC